MRSIRIAVILALLTVSAQAQMWPNPGPGVAGSAGAATCASVLPGLILNLDASNSASVIRTGSNVTAWNDLSGNGNNFTAVNNPQYSATSFPTSLPGISFSNASSQYMSRASFALNSTTLSVFVVHVFTTSVNNAGILTILGSGNSNDFQGAGSLVVGLGSGNQSAYTRAFPTYNVTGSATVNVKTTGGVVFDSVNGTAYSDFSAGTPTASTGTFGATTANFAVGARQTSGPSYSTYYTGTIAEIIVTTSAITGTTLSTLHSCLTTKWGVP